MRLIPARNLLVSMLAVAIGLALAGSASAAVTSVAVTATPSTTAAGGHPDLSIMSTFTYDAPPDSAQDVTLHLGPGLIGSPAAAATCDQATFASGAACPVGSVVGLTTLTATAFTPAPVPVSLSGEVYNLDVPSADTTHLAFLGLRLHTSPSTSLNEISAVTTSTADLGFDSLLQNLPNSFSGAPLQITAIGLTLDGVIPGRDAFFMTNPTQCHDPATVSVTVNSHGAPGISATRGAGYLATDCANDLFSAGLTGSLGTLRTDTPTSVGVTITQPAEPKPSDTVTRHNAHVLQTSVVLPKGMLINPSLGVGLEACTDAQFAKGDAASAAACPAASQIGTASFVAPIIGKTLTGPVYFGTPTPTAANRLFVDVPIPGAHLKLLGRTLLNATDGQVTTVFEGLPQIPFTAFNLTFRGGPHSVLTTPSSCGLQTVTSDIVPFSRLTDATPPNATPSLAFPTSFDGAGAGCPNLFRPYFNGTIANTKAGAAGTFTLRFTRPDRDALFDNVAFKLPAGLTAKLTLSGLTQCPLADAAKGTCAASSKVGSAAIDVGPGSGPATLPGSIFLTKPQVAGDPAGLSIFVPATLGPVNLGDVIVGVRLQLRSNGGLNATSGTLPQFINGVPISIRTATLAFDKPGFMRNPTSCGRKRYPATFGALGGAGVTAYSAFTLSDCGKLGFAPKLAVSLGAKGKNGVGSHPPLTTTITQGAGQSAIRRVHVRLPSALSTNLTSVNAACTQTAFAAGTCAKSANVATATAISPLISGKITGPVYLVRRDPGQLPKLVVQLKTPIAISFDGIVNVGRKGRVGTTFSAVPDLAVTKFVLTFHGGKFGALTAVRNLCSKRLRFPIDFTGQNGKSSKQRPQITVPGCRRS